MIYHVGLLKSGKYKQNVVVQLRSNKDCLDCETWRYLGTYDITKTEAYKNRKTILAGINKQFSANFTSITID